MATGGQGEIDMQFAPLVEMADNVLKYKYIVKNVARKHGKTATFMPKPLFRDNGTGMHVHTSLWKGGVNLFAGSGYAGLSRHGHVRHRRPAASTPRPCCAFTNPTTNSYKRLVPGYEAPVNLAYSRAQPLGVDPHSGVLAQTPRPSGSSSAAPTARAIPTWPSRPC